MLSEKMSVTFYSVLCYTSFGEGGGKFYKYLMNGQRDVEIKLI